MLLLSLLLRLLLRLLLESCVFVIVIVSILVHDSRAVLAARRKQVLKGLRLGGLQEALALVAKGEAQPEEFKVCRRRR